ncbi:MAG TPA: FlgD immunoglobulin-like domain containing protein [bacterium]|nr:FlgD immunoglobulin-like domain containing protein [bacterium]HQI48926.1 FlgD immunoglobulin-like domain containing protein [bacterium]HQJ62970.1 FlgD immunoglobulin-like domain containing protein [bacterium]
MRRLCVILVLLVQAALLAAQTRTLQRRYVPIIIKGAVLPLASFNSTEWRAFKYAQGRWQAVPFQTDQVINGKYHHPWSGGLIDTDDELVFMPQDLGDQAVAKWYDDPTGRSATRLEFEFYDQLDPARKGWIYLYKSSQPAPAGYHNHIDAPTGTAADTIVTPFYKLGHNRDGWIDYVALAANPKLDLIDRLKLRFAGKATLIPGLGNYAATEDTLNKGECSPWPAPIRLMRDQRSKLAIPQLGFENIGIDYQLTYYPASMTLGVTDAQLQSESITVLAGVKTLRQSLDLAPAAAGMKFYSEINRSGVAIDGAADAIDATLKTQTGLHWAMASGQQGTLLLILEMPAIKGGSTKLYYRDSQAGGTNDDTPESGDMKSYGDMGLWAQATGTSSIATSKITMGFSMYMLPERSRDALFADSLFIWVKQPPGVSIIEQIAPPLGVVVEGQQPQGFALSPAWPNPVTWTAGGVQWRMTAPQRVGQVEVRIYNALGQLVRRWSTTAGDRSTVVTWDLRDESGFVAAPGCYYLQVRANGRSATRTLQVLR